MEQYDHDLLHLLGNFEVIVKKIEDLTTKHYIEKEAQMNKLIKDLRDNLIFNLAKAIDKKIDGKEIGKTLDKAMDEKLGKASEKIQRGPVTQLLLEILEGIWNEDSNALRIFMQERYHF